MSTPSVAPYDVVVVGARPAGAATALVQARAGLRVLVVDRGNYGADTVSTHALLRGAVLQLARWGLLDRVAAAGTPPVRRSVFHYGADRIDVPIKPGSGVDALYAPRRTVLDPILVDATRDAGAEVALRRRRHRPAPGRERADYRRRRARRAGLESRRRRPDHHRRRRDGSDGSRLAGGPTDRVAANAAAFIYGYWDGLPGRDYELFYQPGVTAGFFPTNRGQTWVFAGTSPQRYRLESRLGVASAYTRLLDQAAPGVLDADARAPERLRVFAGRRPGFLRRASGPGWALVGDAGYFKDPITAHGLTDALRDAELLGRAIIAAAGGEAPGAVALAAYQATRDRLSERLFAVTDAIASFAWDLDEIRRLLLQLSDAMSDEVSWLRALEPIGAAA
jgi:2-polyprenyl-6-methoxyphenol hydroxylase-like FAD-dependent oxidoreductase